MEDWIRKADILIEAVPYLQAFRGKIIVAKYGGSAIDDADAMRGILQDLVFLSTVGIRAVLVHGGGPMITRKLSGRGQATRFIDGMRVTDHQTIRIVHRSSKRSTAAWWSRFAPWEGRRRGWGLPGRSWRRLPTPARRSLGSSARWRRCIRARSGASSSAMRCP